MPEVDPAGGPVGLNNCDREPIHITGAILPNGASLVLDCETLEVLQAGDTLGLPGIGIEALLGTSAASLFKSEHLGRIRYLARENKLARPRHLLDPMLRSIIDRPIDASVHRSGGALVI